MRPLANQVPEELSYLASTLQHRGQALRVQNRTNEARAAFDESLQLYEQLVEITANEYSLEAAVTVEARGSLRHAQERFHEALDDYERALRTYRAAAENEPEVHLPTVANTLQNIARARVGLWKILPSDSGQTNLSEARKACKESIQILEKLAKAKPLQHQSDLVRARKWYDSIR